MRPNVVKLFLLVVLAVSAPGAPAFPSDQKPYNLLLVLVNCLNKFRLPMYGNPGATTPNLDLFARDAYVFNSMIVPASFTPPVIYELFRAAPTDRTFFLKMDWSEWDAPDFTSYPAVRGLMDRGYRFLNHGLPNGDDGPFMAYYHICYLHYPYDLMRRREASLPDAQKAVYRRLLSGIDEIKLVRKPQDTEMFPALLEYQAFGVRRTELPVDDPSLWNELLVSLKETGDSPAALIAAGLPKSLRRRLSKIRTGTEITPGDKRAIVGALNGLIRDPGSSIAYVLFGPHSRFHEGVLTLRGLMATRWDSQFVADLERSFIFPDPLIKLGSDGSLALARSPATNEAGFLRQLYREALELVFPALTRHHPQRVYIAPSAGALEAWKKSPGYADELELIKRLYDANIADVDNRFGELVARLRRAGVLDRTVVVFAGDHGEGFMEHGQLEHGLAKCYDNEINPPLLVRVPGRLEKTADIDTQLRIGDLLPTVFELMGVPLDGGAAGETFGTSLAPMLNGGPEPALTAFSKNYNFSRSIRRNDGWKLIWEMGTNQRELYDWKKDPGETANLAAQYPEIAGDLEEELKRFMYGQ